ncbi:MAG: DUF1439 domain-containing protein [Gammaproteobacteria bacterium]|nr:DUF1439 domain-containing protein [Gammaproteobacteria bacterium]
MKSKLRYLLICGLALCSTKQATAWTISLTEDQLQARINKRIPIEKQKLIFTVRVSSLDVVLKEGSDRIGFIAGLEILTPRHSSGKGIAELDGQLEYNKKNGQFYLLQPVVRKVSFKNVPDKYHSLLKKVLQKMLQRRLANTPVYQLDQSRTPHKIAKSLLKSVKVIDLKLVLEMGLF